MKKLLFLLTVTNILFTACNNNISDELDSQDPNSLEHMVCENNEILYTTKYDLPIVLNSDINFEANLMLNTYENGIGRLIFDYDIRTIPDSAFKDCTPLVSIKIPDSVHSIGKSAFYGCSSLTNAFIGKMATSIGDSAFKNCTILTNITIPDITTTIGNSAFYGCSSLTSVLIGKSVSSIGSSAFRYCSKLTSIIIPDRVTSIGAYAFSGLDFLKEVYCMPTTPPVAGKFIFNNYASGLKIYVPSASIEAYKTATNWTTYTQNFIEYNF